MYFQNVFNNDFIGVLVLGDRQLSLNFKIAANKNSSIEMVSYNPEPYDLSANANLTLNYSRDSGRSWTAFTVNITTAAANVAAVKVYEIVTALNANTTFNTLYQAFVIENTRGNFLRIHAIQSREEWKTYVSNSSAESKLRINKKAGVAELPSYFSRHTIANRDVYPDSLAALIELSSPVAGVDVAIVNEAGLNSAVVQADWQLLKGRSGLFTFQKITVDGSNRITRIIEYGAGSIAGDFSKQTDYAYTGANTFPDKTTEIPHILISGDLVTP